MFKKTKNYLIRKLVFPSCVRKTILLLKSINSVFNGFSTITISYILFMVIYYIIADSLVIKLKDNNDIVPLIHFFAIFGIISWLAWLSILIKFFKKYTIIDHKRNKDELSYKIASIMSANIDHQFRSPLLAIRSAFKDIKADINEIIKIADPAGNREIDKMIYGCEGKQCKTCRLSNHCKSFPFVNRIIENTENVLESLKQIEDTLEIMKGNRNTKKIGTTDLYTLINNAIMTYRMLYKHNIQFSIDERFKHYILERNKAIEMINVFNNHINNSIDAHASFIAFKFISYNENNNLINLYIVDDGNGIPEEVRNNIWQYSVSSKGDNRGFGMFFCKQILYSLGGDEEITSTSPEGTIIRLSIPCKNLQKSPTNGKEN